VTTVQRSILVASKSKRPSEAPAGTVSSAPSPDGGRPKPNSPNAPVVIVNHRRRDVVLIPGTPSGWKCCNCGSHVMHPARATTHRGRQPRPPAPRSARES
jgi:hypothetical protein